MRIVRTKRARQDLIDIWRFVAEDDHDAADCLLDTIDAKCQYLLVHPHLGPIRNDIREGLRYLRVGQYLALYQVSGSTIRVVRVLHGKRDLQGILLP